MGQLRVRLTGPATMDAEAATSAAEAAAVAIRLKMPN
jgi:hypothetical protein